MGGRHGIAWARIGLIIMGSLSVSAKKTELRKPKEIEGKALPVRKTRAIARRTPKPSPLPLEPPPRCKLQYGPRPGNARPCPPTLWVANGSPEQPSNGGPVPMAVHPSSGHAPYPA